jgi:hypothetical protein
MARHIATLDNLVSSDNSLYVSYHKQVRSGMRMPEDNATDAGRTAAESTVLPNFYEEIVFSALSLDGIGVLNYGSYSITFKDQMISSRASVFEENPFDFATRHRVTAGQKCPPGYRSDWANRADLAAAKLHSSIGAATIDSQFPGILLVQGEVHPQPEFIEVHIWGSIHRRAIERVVGPAARSRADQVMWKSIKRKLDQLGVTIEER